MNRQAANIACCLTVLDVQLPVRDVGAESKTVRFVERAIDILQLTSAKEDGAGVSEIAEHLGLAMSTVHCLLVALSNKGMVPKPPGSDRYLIGHKRARITQAGAENLDAICIATPYPEKVRDRTGDTVALGLKVGLSCMYVAHVSNRNEDRVNPVLGRHYPLHWAATGKAILAYAPAREIDPCLEVVPYQQCTPTTITDPAIVLEELEQARELGSAASSGEGNPGAAAIAAPIRNRRGYAYASASLVGPERRFRQIDLEPLGRAAADLGCKGESQCQILGLGD